MNRKIFRTAPFLGVMLLGAQLAFAQKPTASPELQNPELANADASGLPASWQGYPPPIGANQKWAADPAGGIHMTDQDPGNGLGIAQWVAVTPGTKYTAKANVTGGTGSIQLYLIFTPKIPGKAAEINTIKVGENHGSFSTTEQTPFEATVPEGAAFMRVFLYSSKPGLCDLTVKSVEVTADGSAPAPAPAAAAPGAAPAPAASTSAPAPATAAAKPPRIMAPTPKGPENPGVPKTDFKAPEILPPNTIYTIDFETGDFSQCRFLEGGIKEIVSAPEPVREGQHAMKVSLTHEYHRSEMTGPRSEAFGEYKYGWSLYLPKEFDGNSFFSIVSQWHTWGSGKEYPPDGGPPTSISIAKNTWNLKIQHQDGNEVKTTKQYFSFGPIDGDKGKWTDSMMEVNWQSPQTGGGYLRLYKNGVKVVDYTGPTWFDGKTKGPFFKAGVYKGSQNWVGDPSGAILYVDNFRMGDKSATLDDVDPSKPHPANEKPSGSTTETAPATAAAPTTASTPAPK